MDHDPNRQRWPRIALTLPPDLGAALDELARRNYRDRRHEALRLLTRAIEEEANSERLPVEAA
jgi:metal-responsive CopG/Arc/MetJ family transcriptional regulator